MVITITVSVEVERTEGKFASRDELTEKIMDELESANPESIETDDGASYEVTGWEINDVPQPGRKGKVSV
jgi:hypothetical protein